MGCRSSLPVEKARFIKDDSFLSPHGDALKISGINNIVDPCCEATRSPLLVEKVTPTNHDILPPFGGGLRNSGNQHFDEGVFSTKRRKLRQWVADTSLPEVDEFCSKGFDLVSVLLSRLFPKGNENKCCMDPKSRQVDIGTKHQSPSFPDSDTKIKGFDWKCTKNLIESGHWSYWDDGFSTYGFNQPRDIIISEMDTLGPDCPSTRYTTKTRLEYKYSEPPFDLEDRRIASSCTGSDSSFCLSLEDEFHNPYEQSLKGQPQTLLLGWDFKNEKDEQHSSVTPHDTEMDMFSALSSSSWGNDHSQSLHSSLLCSSLFSNNSSYFASSPHSHLVSFHTHDFWRHVEDEFPSTISCNSKYIKLVEDCNSDNTPEGNSITLFPQDHPWFMKQFFSEIPRPGLNIDLGWKCLSMTDTLSEHHVSSNTFQFPCNEGISSYLLDKEEKESRFNDSNLNGHDWSLVDFQRSHEKEIGTFDSMGCPFLLDNSSWATSEEKYCDNVEWEYI